MRGGRYNDLDAMADFDVRAVHSPARAEDRDHDVDVAHSAEIDPTPEPGNIRPGVS
jgi:hypothetical protein